VSSTDRGSGRPEAHVTAATPHLCLFRTVLGLAISKPTGRRPDRPGPQFPGPWRAGGHENDKDGEQAEYMTAGPFAGQHGRPPSSGSWRTTPDARLKKFPHARAGRAWIHLWESDEIRRGSREGLLWSDLIDLKGYPVVDDATNAKALSNSRLVRMRLKDPGRAAGFPLHGNWQEGRSNQRRWPASELLIINSPSAKLLRLWPQIPRRISDKFSRPPQPGAPDARADLDGREHCVCDLVQAVGLGWSTTSKHLDVLRGAGVFPATSAGRRSSIASNGVRVNS